MTRLIALAGTIVLFAWGSASSAESATVEHARVAFVGIDAKHAEAIANVISAARAVYVEDFGFDMPSTVIASVEVAPGKPSRLYTDGEDRLFLSLPSRAKLAPPAKSGVFNLYGLCHELGHVAMYRPLKGRAWLTGAAAEGWAHFGGSVVVDRVYETKGADLWPEAYDYRQDGTARLDRQLAEKTLDDIVRAAGEWRELDAIIGRRGGFIKLFKQWQQDAPTDAAAVLASAVAAFPDKRQPITEWWNGGASKLFVEPPARASEQTKVTVELAKLTGNAVELTTDDDTSDGKKSIAGGGHARRFAPPDQGEWFVTSVSVYGGRYGPAKAPATKFDLALCDDQMRVVSTWKHPFASFMYGGMGWAKFAVAPPTRVPPGGFYVCVDFHPAATNGVYVGFDSSTKGASQTATPGKPGRPMEQGDWMVRVELDRRTDDAALGTK